MDTTTICCLCAKSGTDYQDVFEVKNPDIKKTINKCFQINITTGSDFHHICQGCKRKLVELEEFRNQVENGQEHINSLIESRGLFIKVELLEFKTEIEEPNISVDDWQYDIKPEINPDSDEDQLLFDKTSTETHEKKKKPSREDCINSFYDFSCPSCSIKFDGWQDYKEHLQCKHKGFPLKFPCCGYNLRLDRKFLYSHIEYHTNPDNLKCPVCDKQFMSTIYKKKHELRHTKITKQRKVSSDDRTCKICGKVLSDKVSYQKHSLLHMTKDEREKLKAQCDYCQKIFRDKFSVLSHIKEVHLMFKPISCDQCGKIFAQRKAFTSHYNIHHSKSMVACTECGMQVKQCNLRKHMRFKHEDDPQICPICFKEVKNRACLVVHRVKKHLGNRFSCEVCGKAFVTKQKCKDHQETHFNTATFSCDQCEYMNNDYANMLKHRKLKHPNATPLVHGTGRRILEIGWNKN